jgi:uncharacterized membrane protein YhhN
VTPEEARKLLAKLSGQRRRRGSYFSTLVDVGLLAILIGGWFSQKGHSWMAWISLGCFLLAVGTHVYKKVWNVRLRRARAVRFGEALQCLAMLRISEGELVKLMRRYPVEVTCPGFRFVFSQPGEIDKAMQKVDKIAMESLFRAF